MSVTLDIPPDFVTRMQKDPEAADAQLRLELALALYRDGQLAADRAAEIAGITPSAFEKILSDRRVPAPYTLTDLEHDLAYARGRS